MPPLWNLKDIALSARYSTNAGPLAAPRLRRFDQYDRPDFACPVRPDQLQVQGDGFAGTLPVIAADRDYFAGTNLVYTMSRNNDLAWIRDWLDWNHRRHKADAVLFADNASTAYSAEELAAVLAAAPGYRKAMLVTVPYLHGPALNTVTRQSKCEFLQVALMNVVLEGWMTGARAVLNCDVDEIVTSADGGSIFDAAASSLMGLVMCKGHWRYAMPGAGAARHADHWHIRPEDDPCAPKYCVRPDSIAGRRQLKIHRVKGFKRLPFVSRDKFSFYHCRYITTSWRYDRSRVDPAGLVADPVTRADLASVFP